MNRTEREVIIVGGGPAGLSTALHLVQQQPAWAGRILVLEKARYPRAKLCGGGITLPGLKVLEELSLSLAIPYTSVNRIRLRYRQKNYLLEGNPAIVIVHRPEFDAWLAQEAQRRGIIIHQEAAVQQVQVQDTYVQVSTRERTYHARALVAADGSNSRVRQQLHWERGHKARLLEIFTPATEQQEAIFDWTPLDDGVHGYYWVFPSLVAGRPMMNRGIFDSNFRDRAQKPALKSILAHYLAKEGLTLADYTLKGHPIHWWSPAEQLSRPRVLLTGDAAGAGALLGEGIAFALGYGQVAAEALMAAHQDNDYSFNDYTDRVRKHWLTKQLYARHWGARIAFNSMRWPLLSRAIWMTSPGIFRLLAALRPQYFPLTKKRMLRAGA